MRFSEQFVRGVAQATDIVELVSQYVGLKKKGKEFVGLCPFHDDHRPSMYVSPAKQIFKCFVCGAGGGVFQFLMLYEKVSFPEAVGTLAERASIPIPQQRVNTGGESEFTKSDLIKVLTFAGRFFRDLLWGESPSTMLDYARKRGLTDESVKRFGLGCAPDDWDQLVRAARDKGYTDKHLIAAGLAVPRESGQGCYDRFRNRLMFPIIDPSGSVIAFGGRAMDESEGAKYINSPESVAFDKSSQLYALNWARESIVSGGTAMVVEGYLDALMPIQHGITNVVATMGTSLTDRHARLLARYAREVVLVFDSDTAGAAATERALELFLVQQFNVRVATIPPATDPCEFCLSDRGVSLRKVLDGAPDALQHVWDLRKEQYEAARGDLARRRTIVEEFLRLVVSTGTYGAIDEVRRAQLAQHIGHMLNVSPSDLQGQMRRVGRSVPRQSRVREDDPSVQGDPVVLGERWILEVLLNRPDLFDGIRNRVDPSGFSDASLRLIAENLWKLALQGRGNLDELLVLEELADYGGLLTDLVGAGQKRENHEQTLEAAIEHIHYRSTRRDLQQRTASQLSDDELRVLGARLQKPDLRRSPNVR